MLISYALGQTSVIVRVKVRQDNTGASPGHGFTGLTNTSTGLIVAAIADNEATTTAYTSAGSTIDTIATLGTYAAPTATHCRLKQVDATNHPGLIELQLDNARYSVANSKSLTVSISGVSGMADCDFVIPLRTTNPYEVNGGLQGLKGTTNPTAGALPTVGTGASQIDLDGSGRTNIGKVMGTVQTARDLGLALPAVAPDLTGGLITFGTGNGQINPDGSGKIFLSATDATALSVAAMDKLMVTGTVTAVTGPGSFSVSFDLTYSGTTATLTDGTLYLSFTSGANMMHSRLITGGTLLTASTAVVTFTSAFGTAPAVNDTFSIITD